MTDATTNAVRVPAAPEDLAVLVTRFNRAMCGLANETGRISVQVQQHPRYNEKMPGLESMVRTLELLADAAKMQADQPGGVTVLARPLETFGQFRVSG